MGGYDRYGERHDDDPAHIGEALPAELRRTPPARPAQRPAPAPDTRSSRGARQAAMASVRALAVGRVREPAKPLGVDERLAAFREKWGRRG